MTKSVTKEAESGVDVSALREVLLKELRAEMASGAASRAEKRTKDELERERWLNEYVQVQLFKDGKEYRDDVCVSVNGENCVVRRGVPVRIKRKFALALDAGRRQDVAAEEYSEDRRSEFFAMEKRFGV